MFDDWSCFMKSPRLTSAVGYSQCKAGLQHERPLSPRRVDRKLIPWCQNSWLSSLPLFVLFTFLAFCLGRLKCRKIKSNSHRALILQITHNAPSIPLELNPIPQPTVFGPPSLHWMWDCNLSVPTDEPRPSLGMVKWGTEPVMRTCQRALPTVSAWGMKALSGRDLWKLYRSKLTDLPTSERSCLLLVANRW